MPASNYPRNAERPRKIIERRIKADWIKRAVSACGAIGWLGFIVAILCFAQARPKSSGFFRQFFGATASSWDKQFLYLSLALFSFAFIACAMGFLFYLRRKRRKTDRLGKHFIVLAALCVVCMTYFLLRFASFLF